MRLLRDIWRILTPAQRRLVLAAQAISLCMALSTVTGIAAIAPFFAVLGNVGLIDQNRWLHWLYVHGGFARPSSFVVTLGVGFIAVVALANLINAAGLLAMNRLVLRIGNQLQSALFEEYLARPYLFHAATNSTTLFNNVIYEVGRLNNGILHNAFLLVTSVVTGSFIFLCVLMLSPASSLLLLLGLASGYAAIYLFMRRRLLRLGEAHSQAWCDRALIVNESLGAIRDVLLLPDRRLFSQGFERTTREVAQTTALIYAAGQIPKHVMEGVAAFVLVGAALWIGAQGERASAWLGELTFVAFSAYRLLPILQQIFACAVRIRADRSGFMLIAPDLCRTRAASGRAASATRCPDSWWQQRPRAGIRVKDVSFRYAPDRPCVLEGVSLWIPARSVVGLVGENGSGKTTLMDVLAGLLVPTTGELQIDGVTLGVGDREAWGARIAYVPQNIFLRDCSILENIAFGVAPSAIDRRRVAQAARYAQLEDLVASLPGGYGHPVGERGVRLSGGQRQRIGIARALYREAAVLLLDEATSALDGLTESELMTTLEGLRGRYTIVLISHRLSTMRCCDVIFQLHGGRIARSGSYEQLAQRSKRFEGILGA